jgi:myosin-5
VDDGADFHTVCDALTDVGIDGDQQQVLFSTLAGVLWLGNLTISPNHSTDSSAVAQDAALANAAHLLGLGAAELAHAITHKKIRTLHELIVKPLTSDEAVDARDALAKAIYAGVFNWIVGRINHKLDMGKKGTGLYIAILDIYGFEQFQSNRWGR